MAPYSSTLAWKIPWMEEPGGLQSMGSLRVGHDWATSLSLFIFMHWRRKWQPTPVFLPGESQGRGAWWATVYGVAQSQTWLKRLSSSSSSSSRWYLLVLICISLIISDVEHFFICLFTAMFNFKENAPIIVAWVLWHMWSCIVLEFISHCVCVYLQLYICVCVCVCVVCVCVCVRYYTGTCVTVSWLIQ